MYCLASNTGPWALLFAYIYINFFLNIIFETIATLVKIVLAVLKMCFKLKYIFKNAFCDR